MTPATQTIHLLPFQTVAVTNGVSTTRYAIAWTALFALHEDIGTLDDGPPGWTISHRPTGRCLLRALPLARAMEAFTELLATATPETWESGDVTAILTQNREFGRAFIRKWQVEP